MNDLAAAKSKISAWKKDPIRFVKDCFQVTPDAWQEEALAKFADPAVKRIAMKACAGPGKSAVLAWFAWNFLTCHATVEDNPKGVAVSVTADNLRDNLWPELSKWQSRSPFLKAAFEWTKERIFLKERPETWFLSARSFSKSASAEEQGRTLSGLHSRSILYLIDESGDINPSVLRSAEQGLSNTAFGKIVQAGNPTSHDGMLYHAVVRDRENWHIVTITGDPEDAKRSPRIDKEWAAQQIKLYGRDNPWVMAYILGQFPPSSINALLSPDEVEAAMNRVVREDSYEFVQKRIGVDVARFGDDETVLFPRQGLQAFEPVTMRNARSNEIAARVSSAHAKWQSDGIYIDVTGGYGAGVEDSCIQHGLTVVPVNFSGKSTDERYFNKRSEMWFRMAEWVRRGGSLPNVPDLVKELASPTYTFVGGKFRLEEKEQIKKRLGFSPDKADALACTFFNVDMPRITPMEAAMYNLRGRKLVDDWDPFSRIGSADWDPMAERVQ